MIQDEDTKFLYREIKDFPYEYDLIRKALDVESGEIEESEWDCWDSWEEVIDTFEGAMNEICELPESEFEVVNGIDDSKDGIYISDYEYKSYCVVYNNDLILEIVN